MHTQDGKKAKQRKGNISHQTKKLLESHQEIVDLSRSLCQWWQKIWSIQLNLQGARRSSICGYEYDVRMVLALAIEPVNNTRFCPFLNCLQDTKMFGLKFRQLIVFHSLWSGTIPSKFSLTWGFQEGSWICVGFYNTSLKLLIPMRLLPQEIW